MWEEGNGPESSGPGAVAAVLLGSGRGGSLSDDGAS